MTARHPPSSGRGGERLGSTDNARSVVLEVASGGRTLLLTGDLEGHGLLDLAAQAAPRRGFDALLAPHHGGRTSNPRWLYDWARPGQVVVSQRPPPDPGRDPLAALAEGRFPLRRTWQAGAVRLAWTPDGLVATGFLDPPAAGSPARSGPMAGASLVPPARPGWASTLLLVAAGWAICLAVMAVEWGAWALVVPEAEAAQG